MYILVLFDHKLHVLLVVQKLPQCAHYIEHLHYNNFVRKGKEQSVTPIQWSLRKIHPPRAEKYPTSQ